jgi:hypothetical protein
MQDVVDVDYKPRRRWYEDQRPAMYIVVEIKTDGGDVRRNSIRSIAAVAVNDGIQAIANYAINLAPLEGAVADQHTLSRYRVHGDAWQHITANAQRPSVAIQSFVNWVSALPGQPIVVASPLTQCSLWLEMYLRRFSKHVLYRGPFEGDLLFAGGGIDLPSLVMGVTGMGYRQAVEHMLPAEWRANLVETHNPKNDAQMHAELFMTMLRIRSQQRA